VQREPRCAAHSFLKLRLTALTAGILDVNPRDIILELAMYLTGSFVLFWTGLASWRYGNADIYIFYLIHKHLSAILKFIEDRGLPDKGHVIVPGYRWEYKVSNGTWERLIGEYIIHDGPTILF
jgi:hypothetical protein